MCALYWQLNDIWQAPTWATIDWGLKWKMAHYYARKFFSPLIVSSYEDSNRFKVDVISDLTKDIRNATLILDLFAWERGLKVVYQLKKTIGVLPALASVTVYDQPRLAMRSLVASRLGKDPVNVVTEDFLVRVELRAGTGLPIAPEAVLIPTALYKVSPEYFGVVTLMDVKFVGRKKFELILRTNKLAPFVWLDVGSIQGWFSDNGFLMTRENMTVYFYSWRSNVPVAEMKKRVNVISLRDVYY